MTYEVADITIGYVILSMIAIPTGYVFFGVIIKMCKYYLSKTNEAMV